VTTDEPENLFAVMKEIEQVYAGYEFV